MYASLTMPIFELAGLGALVTLICILAKQIRVGLVVGLLTVIPALFLLMPLAPEGPTTSSTAATTAELLAARQASVVAELSAVPWSTMVFNDDWIDDTKLVRPWVPPHTMEKHRVDAQCYFQIVRSGINWIGKGLEFWHTDVTGPETVAVLIWLNGFSDCVTLAQDKTLTQGGDTPVLAVIFGLDAGGKITRSMKGYPAPLTVFRTSLFRWRYFPETRCLLGNRQPMTWKIWPAPVQNFPCPVDDLGYRTAIK